MKVLKDVWQFLSGKHLREARAARKAQNEAIRYAVIEGEKRRIRQLKARAKETTDPEISQFIADELARRRRRLSETEQTIKALGI